MIHDRYILLTGGCNTQCSETSAKTFLLDTVTGTWRHHQSLTTGRFEHASCATRSRAFVFGGCSEVRGEAKLSSGEMLPLRGLHRQEWDCFNLGPELVVRSYPLMAATSPCEILIAGGSHKNKILSECAILDVYSLRVVKKAEQCWQFESSSNQHCTTRQGKLVALVQTSKDTSQLLEF